MVGLNLQVYLCVCECVCGKLIGFVQKTLNIPITLNQNESKFVCQAGTCFGGVQAEKSTLLDSHFLLFQLNAHKHKEKHGSAVHITAHALEK